MAGADTFTLLLPFLLSWMVYYIALEKADFIFDEDSLGNLPPVIALVMAFFTARFIVLNPFYQTFFIDFFGKISVGIVGVLGLFTLLAFTGYHKRVIQAPGMVLTLIAMAGAAFIAAGGFGPPWITNSAAIGYLVAAFNWSLETGAIWLLVIGGVMAFALSDPDDGSDISLWRQFAHPKEAWLAADDDRDESEWPG